MFPYLLPVLVTSRKRTRKQSIAEEKKLISKSSENEYVKNK
jgi:hypothetical protein